jgi:HlyD family secretion protein
VLLFAGAIGAATGIVAWRRRAAQVETAPVVRGELLVRVLCDGRLEPPAGGELRVAEPGTVAAVAVHEGDAVQKGQLLLRLTDADLEQRALDARAALRQLQSDTAAVGAALDSARQEAAYREQLVAGDRRLLDQGAIPRAALDADQAAAQQAAGRVRDAAARLGSLRDAATDTAAGAGHGTGGGGGPAERGSRLELAARNVADLERRVAGLVVRAPFPGTVYGLPREAGETVQAGQLVASVTDPDHPHVRCRVDQPDLPRVAPGQRLIVTFNGLPDRQWEGTVARVGTGLREAGGREVGELVGTLADPVHKLPANAAVDVQVVVAQKAGVLSIPRSALRREADHDEVQAAGGGGRGRAPVAGAAMAPTAPTAPTALAADGGIDTAPERFVYVVAHRRAHRRPVKVGLIGLSEVEILDGLAEGERVVSEGPPVLEEDARVAEAKSH